MGPLPLVGRRMVAYADHMMRDGLNKEESMKKSDTSSSQCKSV